MRQHVLSLSLAIAVMASTAYAEDTRSLGVTVSPLGAFVVSNTAHGVASGYSASLGWEFYKPPASISVGGHVGTSTILTDATPISLRYSPWARRSVRPYVGVGPSIVMAHGPGEDLADGTRSVIRMGGEVCGGVSADFADGFFGQLEGRYQTFSVNSNLISPDRQELISASIGIGFRL